LCHLRSYVDGGGQEVEGGGVLLHGQVHEPQVVQDLPVKRRQVVGPFQAADGLESQSELRLHQKEPIVVSDTYTFDRSYFMNTGPGENERDT